MHNLKSNSISFESVRIVNPQPTDSTIKLDLTALVQNLHFEKQVSALITTSSWKSSHASALGSYIGCVAVASNGDPGVDRFRIEVECDTSGGAPVIGTKDQIVNIEFALKCVMGGIESWDNRGGMNHLVMLKSHSTNSERRQSSPGSYGTIKKSPSALDLEAEIMRKRRASVVALKVAAVIADEAKKIDEEFSIGRRRSLEEAAATSFVDEAVAAAQSDAKVSVTSSKSVPSPAASFAQIFRPIPVTPSRPVSSLLATTPVSLITSASSAIIEELSERELEYASKIARPTSPLTTVHPLKRVGSINNLSIAEPIGLNRPASPNPSYSRPNSPSVSKEIISSPTSPLATRATLAKIPFDQRSPSPNSAKIQEIKRPFSISPPSSRYEYQQAQREQNTLKMQEIKHASSIIHSVAQPVGMVSNRQQQQNSPPACPSHHNINIASPKPAHPPTPSRIAVLNAASGRLSARLDRDGDYAPLTTPSTINNGNCMYGSVSSLYASGKSFGHYTNAGYSSYEMSLSSSPH
ncbi:UNVERIFIED_CONTAM: hypothetical protein HDU68_012717 [Siphonaria sp. JEL0065]|nr:hypothetical protein HDU68_012717 [Siphonaria sp. JEL0065]